MKRPAFQFYPADWRKDAALQSCSLAAQGLWINAMCIAHECDPYGTLTVNGKAMTAAQLARLVGISAKECERLLDELEQAGVSARRAEGVIFSRRMVRDEEVRNKRAAGGVAGAEHGDRGASFGSFGGRPAVRKGGSLPPLEPPPSSSSSSSPSGSNAPTGACPPAADEGKGQGYAVPDCPHAAIVDLYHDVLPTLPRLEVLNDTRRGLLRQRWREVCVDAKCDRDAGLQWWRDYFTLVSQSEFLTGRAQTRPNERRWIADLEWLVRPNNFAKVVEGRYNRKEAA